jgi:hypothetical protein
MSMNNKATDKIDSGPEGRVMISVLKKDLKCKTGTKHLSLPRFQKKD